MEDTQRPYIPAAGRGWALPFYDLFVKLLGGDSARKALVEQADLRPNQRVLDIGCGTGTMVTLIKRLHPDVQVVGLDPDPNSLARAKRKASRSGVSIQLDQGFSDELPYPEASFDRVFSTFMFHHLQQSGEKEKTLREIRRVLKPGGRLHLLDFGGAQSSPHGFCARLIHSDHFMKDNYGGRLITLMSQAGLADVKETGRRSMLFGPAAYYQAFK